MNVDKRDNVLAHFKGIAKKNCLETAVMFSAFLHAGVKDRGGVPYFCHTDWIASRLLEHNESLETVMVAYLHDTVEDTAVTIQELREWFSEAVCDAIEVLTFDGIDRVAYIKRIAKNSIARKVKKFDLTHNMDIKRLKNRDNLTEKDLNRIAKYAKEYDFLVGGAQNV